MAPWQAIQQYNNILQPGYTLNQTGTNQTTGGGSRGAGALGGAAVGEKIGSGFGPWGTAIGAGAGAIGGYYTGSDVRLKENIKRVGLLDDGLPVYTYTYKGDDKTQMGVMAQEVERVKPHAVATMDNGYKAVNYGLLG